MRALTASTRAGLVGPWFEPLEPAPLLAIGAVADGRPQKYLGEVKDWPISIEPTGLPPRSTMLPLTSSLKASCPMPAVANG